MCHGPQSTMVCISCVRILSKEHWSSCALVSCSRHVLYIVMHLMPARTAAGRKSAFVAKVIDSQFMSET